MKHLIVLNDPPHGTERSFNGLRMAHALAKNDKEAEVSVFLMADAVLCAKAGQKTPEGYYNVERMIHRVLSNKGRVLMCGTCMDARSLAQGDMMEGATRSTMDELAHSHCRSTASSRSSSGSAGISQRSGGGAGQATGGVDRIKKFFLAGTGPQPSSARQRSRNKTNEHRSTGPSAAMKDDAAAQARKRDAARSD